MRKRLLGVVLACATAAVLSLALTGCSSLPFLNSDSSEYTPTGKDPIVTTPTIGEEGVLRVGVNTTNPPMAGQTTKIVGIDADLAAALADELGLKVQLVDVGTNARTSLQNGTVDIVMGLEKKGTDSSIALSAPYMQTGTALFATSPDAPLPTSEDKIAAQATSMSAWNITTEYGSDAVVSAADLSSAFTMLQNGEVNYVACDAVMGTYAAYAADVKAYAIGLESATSGYCVGVLSENTELANLVNQYMSQLSSTGIVSLIETKWMGTTVDLSNLSMTPAAQKAADEAAAKAAE